MTSVRVRTVAPCPCFTRRLATTALLRSFIAIASLASGSVAVAQTAQLPDFTYQGRLTQNGEPADGTYDLVFTLYDADVGGNVVGTPQAEVQFPVVDGLFTASLAFPGVFTGNQIWLDVSVNGQSLSPRQAIATTPVAQYALSGNPGPPGATGAQGPAGPSLLPYQYSVDTTATANVAYAADLTCPDGGLVISGGAGQPSVGNLAVALHESYPSSANAWHWIYANTTATNISVRLYIVCVPPASAVPASAAVAATPALEITPIPPP